MLSKKTKYAINALVYIAKHSKKTNRSLFDYKNEKETADDNGRNADYNYFMFYHLQGNLINHLIQL